MIEFKSVVVIDDSKIQCDPSYVELIQKECDVISKGTDKYAANYSFSRLDLKGHRAFDLLLHNGEIAGWCGLYNGGRYPDGVFRIMNRLYLHPRFRSPFFKPYTRALYRAQVERHRQSISLLFLSRNELKGKYHLKRWIKYGSGEPGWELSEGLVKVAPGEDQKSYQYIAYKKIKDIAWPNSWISEDKWHMLPD